MNIATTVKAVQDIMRKDVGVDGDAQRLGQLVWMLFLKILDDKEIEWEAFNPGYASPLPEEFRWRSWAAPSEGLTGETLKSFIDSELFPALQGLGQDSPTTPLGNVVRHVFADSYDYMKSGQLIRSVINRIEQDVNMNDSRTKHAFGDMYEQLLKSLQAAGNAGEFYTPRALTAFIVNRLDPKLNESVFDPACGTGGFLSGAIEHKRAQYVRTAEDEGLIGSTIYGVEKKPLPYTLAVTNMILHGIEVPTQIRRDNTLARPLTSWGKSERFDVIAANPPFGGSEEDGVENNFPAEFRTRETADLFMALFMRILKPGGRAGVVLPDGFLFGDGVKARLKERLMSEFNLHTIVRLPKGVFNPYTGISTNLLFFTKGGPTKDVWFYDHPYPRGYKNYSKTRPLQLEEFEPEMLWWGDESDGFAARVPTAQAWRVSSEEIRNRGFNLDMKNPRIAAAESRDPKALLADYHDAAARADVLREQLRSAFDVNSSTDWAFVSRNFKTLFTTESSVELFRQVILELAMSGRLVPQSPDDEPASVLLERIASEKRSLVLAGKLRAAKPLAPIGYGEKPHVLPAGWVWARLGSLGDWGAGATPPRGEQRFYGGEVPWFKSGELVADFISTSVETITEDALRECSLRLNQPGDVLVAMYGATIGKTAILKRVATTNQAVCACTPMGGIESRFMLLRLRALKNFLIGLGAGGAQPNISKIKIINTVVPLPPLEEQERIVHRVDELMALCDQFQESISAATVAHTAAATAITANLRRGIQGSLSE